MGLVAAGLSCGLCGCSISIPLGPLVDADTVTGSIAKPSDPALASLDEPAAQAALALALELTPPQSRAWRSASGVAGRVTALPEASSACRGFLAELDAPAGPRPMQGVACRAPQGFWEVARLQPRG